MGYIDSGEYPVAEFSELCSVLHGCITGRRFPELKGSSVFKSSVLHEVGYLISELAKKANW